jgi:hypothetical protein
MIRNTKGAQMITITKMQFALIAAVASIMTTAMYAFLQALYSMGTT